MSATGKGRLIRSGWLTMQALRTPTFQEAINGGPDVVANDYFWGGYPPAPTKIPYSWLTPPARWRPDQPRNLAIIGRASGVTADARDRDSIDAVGERPFTATLDTPVVDDPVNYADWIVGNYTEPRPRMPVLRLNLLSRTPTECWRILSREVGDAIHITNVPAGWPDGVDHLVIEGITHTVAADIRFVDWNTAPLIGAEPGEAGPWFRADESTADTGADLLAF